MAQQLISCICPTYGRMTALGESLECFLRQDYRPRELVILNDAPVAITSVDDERLAKVSEGTWRGDGCTVRIYNEPLFSSLGLKYRRLLELARGDIIAHWEDDDLYLPSHLSGRVGALVARQAVKSDLAHVLAWQAGSWRYEGIQGNVFEAQMAYRVGTGRRIGYKNIDNPCFKFLCMLDAGDLVDCTPPPEPTYCFRWDTRVPHGQCVTQELWRAGNTDFAETLTARDIEPYLTLIGGDNGRIHEVARR